MEAIVLVLSKAGDVDSRVQALVALRAHLDAHHEVPEEALDGITLGLKAALRQANAQLATAALNALLPYLTTAVSPLPNKQHHLKLLTSALLPSPHGLIDRLSDARSSTRDLAREVLVELGTQVYTLSRPGPRTSAASSNGSELPVPASKASASKREETAFALWDRALKEQGLGGKNSKTKEQSLQALTQIRARCPAFGLRAYLPLLVDLLEDGDGGVRDSARETVITLFSSPSTNSLAKTELKKTLATQGVRKTIVDPILAAVLGGGAPSSSSLSASTGSSTTATSSPQQPLVSAFAVKPEKALPLPQAPPDFDQPLPGERLEGVESFGVEPIEVVYVASSKDLEQEFVAMLVPFEGKETEHNWLLREKAVNRVRGMLKGDVYSRYPDSFVVGLRSGFLEGSLKALASLRTTLCSATCHCYTDILHALGPAFDPLVETILGPLSRMANFTKTVVVQQTQHVITVLLGCISALPRIILPFLSQASVDKTPRARTWAFQHLKTYIDVHTSNPKGLHALEAAGAIEGLDKILRKGLADPSPLVKEPARAAFWAFEAVWPGVARKTLESLDGMARKALERAMPNAVNGAGSSSSAAPAVRKPALAPKRTGLAAHIAAQRKAKEAQEAREREDSAAVEAVAATAIPLTPTPLESSFLLDEPNSPFLASPLVAAMIVPLPDSPLSITQSPLHGRTSPIIRTSVTPESADFSPRPRVLSADTASLSPSVARSAPAQTPPPPLFSSRSSSARSPPQSEADRPLLSFSSPVRPSRATPPPAPPASSSLTSSSSSAAARMRSNSGLSTRSSDHGSLMSQEELVSPRRSPSPNRLLSGDDEEEDTFAASGSSIPRTPIRVAAPASTTIDFFAETPSQAALRDHPVEDALSAQASQAISAESQLLEFAKDETSTCLFPSSSSPYTSQTKAGGSSPLRSASTTPPASVFTSSLPLSVESSAPPTPKAAAVMPSPPRTPALNSSAATMRLQSFAAFQDSPAAAGNRSPFSFGSGTASPKHADLLLKGKTPELGLWRKRLAALDQKTPFEQQNDDLQTPPWQAIGELSSPTPSTGAFQTLLHYSAAWSFSSSATSSSSTGHSRNRSDSSCSSGSSSNSSNGGGRGDNIENDARVAAFWREEGLFELLFDTLVQRLGETAQQSADSHDVELSLALLEALLENQSPLVESHETSICSILWQLRSLPGHQRNPAIRGAMYAVVSLLARRVSPIYFLAIVSASLRQFIAASSASSEDGVEERAAPGQAFGLLAIGRGFMLLPGEIVEEELPRLRDVLVPALSSPVLSVREAAATAILAAQLVLRDETLLFSLLEGLTPERIHLLTYLFDKNQVRDGAGAGGRERVEKEMRRLSLR